MRKSVAILALLLVAACNGSEINDPPVTTTVTVTATPTQIPVHATAQASAVVKDQHGNTLSDKEVTWTSSNNQVVAVSSSGVYRGIAPGTAEIRGSVDGKTGSSTIQVLLPIAACQGGSTTISLEVGEVRMLSSAATAGCLKVASSASASAYLVVAASSNAIRDQIETFVLKSDEGENVPSTTLLAANNGIGFARSQGAALPGDLQLAYEAKLRRFERRELSMPVAQRALAEGLALGSRTSMSMSVAIPAVGDKTQFRVPQSCSSFTTITATARHISSRSILYTDDASPPGGFTDADLQAIGGEFDNLIYPTDIEYFGTPLDSDANSRVIILYTPEVNKLTAAGNPDGFVGGFFFAGDLFPTSACQQSNVSEIFYVLTPDPNGVINGNKRTTEAVRQGTRGTIAHELQHMINASERIRSPIEQDFEEVWLDEALSHFAEDVNGRVLMGLNESGNYTFDQLNTNRNNYLAFFFQNFARFMRYLRAPAFVSPTSDLADSDLNARGAAWALLRYTADHYAPGGDIRAFTRALASGPATGVLNLTSRAGSVPFDTLIAGWLVTNYSDDAEIAGLPVKYTYKTYNMRNIISRENDAQNPVYPLPVVPITGTGFVRVGLQIRSGSAQYFFFSRPAGGQARSFRMLNPDVASAASFTGATLYFLRIQ